MMKTYNADSIRADWTSEEKNKFIEELVVLRCNEILDDDDLEQAHNIEWHVSMKDAVKFCLQIYSVADIKDVQYMHGENTYFRAITVAGEVLPLDRHCQNAAA